MSKEKISALAFRFRGGVWTLFFLLVLFFIRRRTPAPTMGLIAVALGQGIRFWAAGSIGQYRGEIVGAAELVTWGPYAFARNPLYLGNALIGVGWCALSGNPKAFLLFFVVFMILYVTLVIPYEENYLKRLFPDDFARYSDRVGRFFPLRTPTLADLSGPFDWGVLWKSERHSLWVTLIGTLLLLSRRWW
jgi:protein-S-isoprenylcysteine O-methyltransferase Ste14